jgi:hypothetical protein
MLSDERVSINSSNSAPLNANMAMMSAHCRCADPTFEMNASPVQPLNRQDTYFTPAV